MISELIVNHQQQQQQDVYNIPWDFKNKLIQQQSQSRVLKPPVIQPPPPPIKQQQPQEEYCAPWDLKLQEERFKNLTISTSTTTIGTTKSVNTTSPLIIVEDEQQKQQQTEYSPPWDQKQQNILLKQIQPKLSVSCSSSSSLSSLNSTKTNSPTSIQQKSDLACGLQIDKFNSLDSNSSSNNSESSFKPIIKPRQSFRQTLTASVLQPPPPPIPPLPNISSKVIVTSTLQQQQPPPLPQIPAYMVTLEKQSWFHGRITRKQAEFLLQDKPIGSFLVRQSESGNTNDFSLSLV